MKLLNLNLIVLISLFLFFGSCSIEKRVHMRGYHVSWKATANSNLMDGRLESNYELNNLQPLTKLSNRRNNCSRLPFRSFDKSISLPKFKSDKFQNSSDDLTPKVNPNQCDLIIFKNGDEIEAKVLEVGIYDLKYKKCDNLEGPTFTESKNKVFMIKHFNGTKTVFDNSEETSNSTTDEDDYLKTFSSDDKSFPVAVGLWFFFGLIGIHRFYLGYIGLGVLYLLTGGLCGIGWIVDGILFLTGSLKPKNGKYIDA